MTDTKEKKPAKTTVGPNAFPIPAEYPDIVKALPHRYPFLLVDRVTECEPGKRLVAYKNVTANEAFFQGHFPGFPVMPGVLQAEAMAQAAAILVYATVDASSGPKVPFLISLDNVKFRRPVVPGDRLVIEAEVVLMKSSLGKVKCKATVDGERASEAEIMAAIRDMPTA
jgi:3-hydroxyacyl-[acyl-carrier-protein] dehydratase